MGWHRIRLLHLPDPPSPAGYFFSTSYQLNTENDLNYKLGNTLIVNAGLNYLVTDLIEGKPLTTSLQVNSRQAPRDAFMGEEVPSTGGRWIYLTPGLTLQASPNTAVYMHIQVPVYQYVNEINLVPRYGFILGISHAF